MTLEVKISVYDSMLFNFAKMTAKRISHNAWPDGRGNNKVMDTWSLQESSEGLCFVVVGSKKSYLTKVSDRFYREPQVLEKIMKAWTDHKFEQEILR